MNPGWWQPKAPTAKPLPRVLWAIYRCRTCGRMRQIGVIDGEETHPDTRPCGLPQDDGTPCAGTSDKRSTP